ncbi:TPA: hypothetical protein ACHWKL_004816 [Providencia stuartii]|uniref:Uncharacterized protein n=5 Tax=Providencia stuartii TaxID=588 RepID=A0AAJ1JDM2_PROST|nr:MULTISPECIES: hypothetical protein [Providencia]SST02935.1 Uncharacterised protein [Acinetobacter baumannii]AFH95622.1 hypothetical protein S70_19130 [Providencia stuartii MRSN 2154]AIN65128.1 hypothetical protein DR96_2739 [Providencia stuartii]AMG66267.1 hypothetical protein AL507_06555 [Providencia stuartii]APG49634.1 hypothetical protein BGK56_01200 [Providencia stuartii]
MNMVKLLITVLLIGCSFLLGVMVNYKPNPDLIKLAKYNVADYLSYPESASFRNIKYNFIRSTADKGEVGYVCGEVLRVKNAKIEGYKRFAVKTYKNQDGRIALSIPLVEGDYDLLPLSVMESLWTRYCQ